MISWFSDWIVSCLVGNLIDDFKMFHSLNLVRVLVSTITHNVEPVANKSTVFS